MGPRQVPMVQIGDVEKHLATESLGDRVKNLDTPLNDYSFRGGSIVTAIYVLFRLERYPSSETIHNYVSIDTSPGQKFCLEKRKEVEM